MTRHMVIIARGILKYSGQILFCYHKERHFFFLPGGHVEQDEDAIRCLQREFQEECRLDIHVGAFLGCLECHWQDENKQYQEFNMIFNVHMPSNTIPVQILATEPHIGFAFLSHEAVLREGQHKILPKKIVQFLHGEALLPQYIIENQRSSPI